MADRDDKLSRTYVKVSCGNCGNSWKMRGSFSVYGLQAIESNPCHVCGAYTLCLETPDTSVPQRLALNYRRRLMGEILARGES